MLRVLSERVRPRERTRTYVAHSIIGFVEAFEDACGRKDMEINPREWRATHVLLFEMVHKYKAKVTLVIYMCFASAMGKSWLLYKHWSVYDGYEVGLCRHDCEVFLHATLNASIVYKQNSTSMQIACFLAGLGNV